MAARQFSLTLTISWSCPSSRPLHRWCHPAISSSDTLFSFCLQFFPASGSFPMSQLFTSGDYDIRASASALASVLPMSIQCLFFLRLTVLTSLLSKGLSRVSPAPRFEGINFSALCLLYGSALTVISDSWKDHSLDHPDFCWQVMFCFSTHFLCFCHWFPARKQSFNFMAAATICSDFRAQEEEIHLWFHVFPFCLPWNDGAGCHDLSFLFSF